MEWNKFDSRLRNGNAFQCFQKANNNFNYLNLKSDLLQRRNQFVTKIIDNLSHSQEYQFKTVFKIQQIPFALWVTVLNQRFIPLLFSNERHSFLNRLIQTENNLLKMKKIKLGRISSFWRLS